MSGRQVSVNTDASTGYFHIADIDIKMFELRTQTPATCLSNSGVFRNFKEIASTYSDPEIETICK